MDEVLLVDGYNVINAWPELEELFKHEMGHARDKLAEYLAGYGTYKKYQTTIVFDAHQTEGLGRVENVFENMTVVYTAEKETADSYIERSAYLQVRQGRRVYVVTNDWAEQLLILGAGAFRIPARELVRDICKVRREIQQDFTRHAMRSQRREIGNRLNEDVLKRLDEMRRKG